MDSDRVTQLCFGTASLFCLLMAISTAVVSIFQRLPSALWLPADVYDFTHDFVPFAWNTPILFFACYLAFFSLRQVMHKE